MPVDNKQIVEEYRRRMQALNASCTSSIRATAQKFGIGEGNVRRAINMLAPKHEDKEVRYKIGKSQYKDMRKVLVTIGRQEVVWHTKMTDKEINDKITKLRNRRAIEM